MNAPVVIKLGGAAVERAAATGAGDAVWKALASIADAHLGRLVLVHGGGAEIDRRLARLGLHSEKRDGVRITPDAQIDEVVATLAGVMSRRVVGALLAEGVRAVGLALSDGGMTTASKSLQLGFDPGRVGAVTGGDPTPLTVLLRAGFTPVLNPIAADARGRALNVNADDAAAAVAALIGARMLVLLTDTPGVLDGAGRVIPALSAERIESMISSGEISGGMVVKARGAARAAAEAGAPAAIAPADNLEGLHGLLRGEAFGTLVLPPHPLTVSAMVEPAARRRQTSGASGPV